MEDLNQKLTTDDMLIRYFNAGVTNVLSEYFDVKCCDKGHYWFTTWDGHCRKAFNLFATKGYLYPILWGYNFDFIPTIQNNGKFIYHRTEKAVTLHVENHFRYHIDCDPKKLTLNEIYEIKKIYSLSSYIFDYMNINDVAAAYKYIEEITRRNIPFMLDFFERVRTVDDVIEEMDKQIEENNLSYYDLCYNKAFLLAYQKRMDEATASLKMIYENIPEDLMARLEKVYAME